MPLKLVASSPTPARRQSSSRLLGTIAPTGSGSCSPLHTNGNVNDIRPLERVDLRQLWVADRRELVHILIAENHKDNLRLLRHQRRMMDRVGTQQPTTKVPWRNLRIEVHYRMTLLLALAGNLSTKVT